MENLTGVDKCDAKIRIELWLAGIPSVKVEPTGEVLTSVKGVLNGWTFTRQWYYWVADALEEGDMIPTGMAEFFNQRWKTEVRIDGCCGGKEIPATRGSVGEYHIDTQAGLCAFAEMLNFIDRHKVRPTE